MDISEVRAHIWRVTWSIPHAGCILFYPILCILLWMLYFTLRMTDFLVGFWSIFGSLSYALVEKMCRSQHSLKSHLSEDFIVTVSCSDCYLLQLWKILWFIFNVWHQNWLPIVVTPKLLFILAQLFWEALKYSFKSWTAVSWCALQHQYRVLRTPVSVPYFCWWRMDHFCDYPFI